MKGQKGKRPLNALYTRRFSNLSILADAPLVFPLVFPPALERTLC